MSKLLEPSIVDQFAAREAEVSQILAVQTAVCYSLIGDVAASGQIQVLEVWRLGHNCPQSPISDLKKKQIMQVLLYYLVCTV